MNTRILLGALLCISTYVLMGQSKQLAQYSYISDRTFTSPDQLMGYDFKPALREVPGEEPEEVSVGKYSFGITRKNLYVEGPNIRGVYSVNNINTTEYGFILQTMNARDPTIQGHLKIVVDEIGQVEGLIFKRSTHDKEVIFFLRVIPSEVAQREAEYFTHKGEKRVEAVDSLWTNIEVRPFIRVFQDLGGIQQRILPSDSVYLNFYKIVKIEEKEKGKFGIPVKKGRRGLLARKSKTKEEAPLPEETYVEASIDKAIADSTRLAMLQNLGAKLDSTKLIRPDTVDADSLLSNVFDTVEPDTLSLAVDSLALDSTLPADTSLTNMMIDSLSGVTADTLGPEVKLKITTEYYVDLNSFMRYDDGTSEMQHKQFLVNGIVERENTGARKGGNRFQWELNLHKRPNAYIYLNERRQINSIVIDGQKFYMRGQ